MRLLRSKKYPVNPWKNGGGETREIAVFPAGADMDNFDWRLSMATVATDGPFSLFDGIERTLFILEGDGIELVFGTDKIETLGSGGSLTFAADVPVKSVLLGSKVVDLNVMTRRGGALHKTRKLTFAGDLELDFHQETTALFCVSGKFEVVFDRKFAELGTRDCVITENNNVSLRSLDGEAEVIVVEIDQI